MNEEGYELLGKEYKRKSRLYPRTIQVTSIGKKLKKIVHENQVVFYGKKYDRRAKAERAATLAKVQDLINRPGSYAKGTLWGCRLCEKYKL